MTKISRNKQSEDLKELYYIFSRGFLFCLNYIYRKGKVFISVMREIFVPYSHTKESVLSSLYQIYLLHSE